MSRILAGSVILIVSAYFGEGGGIEMFSMPADGLTKEAEEALDELRKEPNSWRAFEAVEKLSAKVPDAPFVVSEIIVHECHDE